MYIETAHLTDSRRDLARTDLRISVLWERGPAVGDVARRRELAIPTPGRRRRKTANPSTAVRLRCLLNTAQAYEPPIGIRTHPFKCFAAADDWLSHAVVAPSRVASRAATLLLAILPIF